MRGAGAFSVTARRRQNVRQTPRSGAREFPTDDREEDKGVVAPSFRLRNVGRVFLSNSFLVRTRNFWPARFSVVAFCQGEIQT
jgi:hypothetical protein